MEKAAGHGKLIITQQLHCVSPLYYFNITQRIGIKPSRDTRTPSWHHTKWNVSAFHRGKIRRFVAPPLPLFWWLNNKITVRLHMQLPRKDVRHFRIRKSKKLFNLIINYLFPSDCLHNKTLQEVLVYEAISSLEQETLSFDYCFFFFLS